MRKVANVFLSFLNRSTHAQTPSLKTIAVAPKTGADQTRQENLGPAEEAPTEVTPEDRIRLNNESLGNVHAQLKPIKHELVTNVVVPPFITLYREEVAHNFEAGYLD